MLSDKFRLENKARYYCCCTVHRQHQHNIVPNQTRAIIPRESQAQRFPFCEIKPSQAKPGYQLKDVTIYFSRRATARIESKAGPGRTCLYNGYITWVAAET